MHLDVASSIFLMRILGKLLMLEFYSTFIFSRKCEWFIL